MSGSLQHSRFRVSGMDCAACAAKVEAAARRVDGIEEVTVSVVAETLNVRHATPIDLEDLARRLDSLGYGLSPLVEAGRADTAPAAHDHGSCCGAAARESCCDHDHDHAHGHDHDHSHSGHSHASGAHAHAAPAAAPEAQRWWQSGKVRLAAASGLALAAAFLVGVLVPAVALPAFLAAMLVGLVPIARRAVAAARSGMPFTIEMLMTIAAVGATIIGATEEAAAVVFLFLIGEVLEGVAAGRARDGIRALTALVPKTALVERGGATREIPAAELRVGEVILVRPGERMPADGVVLSGESAVDEAPVTGESVPVAKAPSSTVFAGTVNGDGALRVRVTAAARDNTIARVVKLVEEAQEAKAPTERFIDRFSRFYTPAVTALALLVTVIPPLLFAGAWEEWIYKGLALLLIGCPCALVISTPAAIAAGLSAGARRGLLMKGGAVLEMLGKITMVCFDKTGTLTQGKPEVTDVIGFDLPEQEVVRLAAALETGSSHPLARAVLDRAADMGIAPPAASDARALAGKGVSGRVEGRELFLGAPQAVEAAVAPETTARIAALSDAGKTVSVLLVEGRLAGILALRDEPRPDATQGLEALKAAGVRTLMLTGDNARAAHAIGKQLDIEVRAELLPQDKQHMVAALRAEGLVVAQVGDGINDAPALATADVGIAMGGGTDVALETADAAILNARVGDVAALVQLSRRTMGNIRQNIAISLGLKGLFLVTTVAGITGLWPAVLADTGATVLVTLNALRLLAYKPQV